MVISNMRKALDSVPYLLSFISLEVVVFFVLYVVHALLLKGFGFSDSLVKGGYEFFWRIISLQVFMQLGFLILAANFDFQKNYLVILCLSLVAYSIASLFSFSDVSSIWKLMKIPNKDEMGEGFAICCSVTIAYLFFLFLGLVKS